MATGGGEAEASSDGSETDRLFSKYYAEWKGNGATTSESRCLGRFHDRGPDEEDSVQHKLQEEARSRFLQRQSEQLLDNDQLKAIWTLLDEHHTPPTVDDEKMIGYGQFRAVAAKAPDKAAPFFTASVFGKLQTRDPYGRVPVVAIFNYLMRKTWLRQSRIGLSLYDLSGLGYLSEKDLELYISELIPTMPQLERLEESFHSFYTCTAVRRFLFFLDPKRLGRVRIVDVLASGFLDDLLELRDAPAAGGEGDESARPLEDNWFSAENALRVYGQYLKLDSDRNGMLSPSELREFGTASLTDVFVERVFQECLTYEGEMDYKAYLDFVLAQENKRDRAALDYFMRILDVRQRGYIDCFAINYFFRAIQKQLDLDEQPLVNVEDMCDEMFDLVKPKVQQRITVDDLVACCQGDVVVSVLSDFDGFWRYENREYLSTEPDQDNGGEAQC